MCYFQFLMTMNKAVLNLCVQDFCEHRFLFHLCKYLGIELVSHLVSLCLTLWETANLFPTFCISAGHIGESQLLHSFVIT